MTEERCKVKVGSHDRWPVFHDCGRKLKPGFDKCGLHVAADERRRRNAEARQANYAHEGQVRQRVKALSAELGVDLWAEYAPHGIIDGLVVIREADLRRLTGHA